MRKKLPGRHRTCLLLLAVLGAGCSREKRDYLEAGEVHRKTIAHVSALLPFLAPREPEQEDAAYRYAARRARTEIIKQALNAADHQAFGGDSKRLLTPTERIAREFARLVPRCTLPAAKDLAEDQKHLSECNRALTLLQHHLAIEDERAQRLGLRRGTIPHLGSESITEEARRAAAEISQAIEPPAEELLRRRLWTDPDASEEALKEACAASLRELKKKPGIHDEMIAPCNLMQEVARALFTMAGCDKEPGPQCLLPSSCAMLQNYGRKSDEMPTSFAERLQMAVAVCQRRIAEAKAQQQPGAPGALAPAPAGAAPAAGIPAAAEAAAPDMGQVK